MHYAVSQVVDMVGDNTVVTALEEMASVVDIGVEVVRIVATAELTPRMYFVVAIDAVDILGSVVVAMFILPINMSPYTFNSVCLFI
jgi:hypothetical protein